MVAVVEIRKGMEDCFFIRKNINRHEIYADSHKRTFICVSLNVLAGTDEQVNCLKR